MLRKGIRILLVIVNIVHVGHDVDAAARIDARSCRIRRLRRPVNRSNHLIALTSSVNIPSLVKRAPPYDRRVVEIALHFVEPLRQHGIYAVRVCVIESPVRVLSPDHVSHAVAVIEKPFLEHLLVKSRSVEAHRRGTFDIRRKLSVGGRGVYPCLLYTSKRKEEVQQLTKRFYLHSGYQKR